jgi:hypothetical protein
MPFTPAASRPHSPTHEDDDNQAAAALDLSQHDDDAAAASQDAYTPDEHDVSMSGGDGFEYEEERKSAEKPSRRSSGGSRASAAAAPAASADAPSSGGKSKARAPKRAREPKAPLPRPKALGGGRYGRQTFGIVQGQSTLIEEEDENVGSDQEGKIDAFRRTKRTRIAPVGQCKSARTRHGNDCVIAGVLFAHYSRLCFVIVDCIAPLQRTGRWRCRTMCKSSFPTTRW